MVWPQDKIFVWLFNGMQGCVSEPVYTRTLTETFLKLDPKLAKGATGDGHLCWPRGLPPCQPFVCNPRDNMRPQHLNAFVLPSLRRSWLPDKSAIVAASNARPGVHTSHPPHTPPPILPPISKGTVSKLNRTLVQDTLGGSI